MINEKCDCYGCVTMRKPCINKEDKEDKMYEKQMMQCINAAEMGLTQEQTSELLEIPFGVVLALTKEFNIKFRCLRSKNNDRNNDRQSNTQRKETNNRYDSRSRIKPKAKVSAKITRTRRFAGYGSEEYKRLKYLYLSDKLPKEKQEPILAHLLKELREQEHETIKGPRLPYKKINIGSRCFGLY